MDEKLQRKPGESSELITFVKDRPGHDHRYAIDPSNFQKNWNGSQNKSWDRYGDDDWLVPERKEWLSEVTSWGLSNVLSITISKPMNE